MNFIKDCIRPRVFVTTDLKGYGIKKPNLIRTVLIAIGLVTKLYKPLQTVAMLTDCLSMDKPSDTEKRAYLAERATVIEQTLHTLSLIHI